MKRLLAVGLLAVAFNAFAGEPPPAAGDKPAAEKGTKSKKSKKEKTEKTGTEKETKDEGMKK